MKKVYTKLFITVISLLVSSTMVLSVSYAWLVLSKSPAVNGISVMIGGGKTILLAADMTATVTDEEGTRVVHYPGKFSDNLNFSSCDTYSYLNECSGLMPVSTADGRYWMIPEYDEDGELLPVKQFTVDDQLAFANRDEGGCYMYLDFWVVSPGSAYDLHVSTDKQTLQGSYFIELPDVKSVQDGRFTLANPQGIVPASARVGFLVSGEKADSADMTAYLESADYDDRYSGLLGRYQEPGQKADPVQMTSFTIYEPNGMLHPSDAIKAGSYQITQPLGYDPFTQQIQERTVSEYLTVQNQSSWTKTETGLQLEEIFQAAIIEKTGLTAVKAKDYFYRTALQGQVSPYLSTGLFVKNTEALYSAASDGFVSQSAVEGVQTASASDGAVIARLERNTPQRIRMYVWLEGQDADCQNTSIVSASQMALKIELAGSTP